MYILLIACFRSMDACPTPPPPRASENSSSLMGRSSRCCIGGPTAWSMHSQSCRLPRPSTCLRQCGSSAALKQLSGMRPSCWAERPMLPTTTARLSPAMTVSSRSRSSGMPCRRPQGRSGDCHPDPSRAPVLRSPLSHWRRRVTVLLPCLPRSRRARYLLAAERTELRRSCSRSRGSGTESRRSAPLFAHDLVLRQPATAWLRSGGGEACPRGQTSREPVNAEFVV